MVTRILKTRLISAATLGLIVLAGGIGVASENAAIEARMREDMFFLAGEKCEGRGIRTKGIHVAADHIAAEFKKAGLKPAMPDGSYFQPFTVNVGAALVPGSSVSLQGPLNQSIQFEIDKQFTVMALGGSGKVSAPLVFAGYGVTDADAKYDDYEGMDVAGKIVVVLRGAPKLTGALAVNARNSNVNAKAANAAGRKVAGIISVNDSTGSDTLSNFRTFATVRTPVAVPMVQASRTEINKILRSALGSEIAEIEKTISRGLKPASRELKDWTCSIETKIDRDEVKCKNVIGVLDGAGPLAGETIVIGAHYDHLGYGGAGSLARVDNKIHFGADDNASGTTTLIELARRFGAVQNRQGRRLVLMAFSAEESGLLGAFHYCKEPIFPLDKTAAMYNMDMVGRLRDDKLEVNGIPTGKGFNELADKLNEKHKFNLTKDTAGSSQFFGASDHFAFYQKNIPVMFLFTGMHREYHRPTDTPDTVNIAGMRKIADFSEDAVTYMATVDPRPEFTKMPARTPPRTGGNTGPRLGVMPDYRAEGEGMKLTDVTEGGLAAKAGLKANDRIMQINDKPVANVEGYMQIMGGFKKGDKIVVNYQRDGKPAKVQITLE